MLIGENLALTLVDKTTGARKDYMMSILEGHRPSIEKIDAETGKVYLFGTGPKTFNLEERYFE